MNHEQIIEVLRDACATAGSQAAWARAVGLSEVYISDVLSGRRPPGKSVLDALGVEKVVSYRRKE